MEKIPVVVVCGPTASGKTSLGVELALELGGEVVSADSMQVYRRLDIGTAKPNMEERRGIPHHMIDVAEPWESYSVARYCSEAAEVVSGIVRRGKLPIIVGGTGLYIDRLLDNTDFSAPMGDERLRAELAGKAEIYGREYVHSMLKQLDPEEAAHIHPNNLKRVIRAIELITLTGESRERLNEKSRRPSPYRVLRLAIDYPRDVLYGRIDRRVDEMLERGLVDEVKRELLPVHDRARTAVQAIGYKEVLDYLDGSLTLEQAVNLVKQGSRRYAKRQLTWLRGSGTLWLEPETARTEALKITDSWRNGEKE